MWDLWSYKSDTSSQTLEIEWTFLNKAVKFLDVYFIKIFHSNTRKLLFVLITAWDIARLSVYHQFMLLL